MDFRRVKRNIRHKLIWKLGGIPEDMPIKLPTIETSPLEVRAIRARVTDRDPYYDNLDPKLTLTHMIARKLMDEGIINVRVVDEYQYGCITYEAELRVVMGED